MSSLDLRGQLRLLTAPPKALLDFDLVKQQVNVDFDDDDDYIASLVAGAQRYLDGAGGVLARALMTQAWAYDLDDFPRRRCRGRGDLAIEIPLPPLQSIESVTYWDTTGVQQTLEPSSYLDHVGGFGLIEPAPGTAWPQTQRRRRAATISFTAGFGDDVSDVPDNYVQAARMLVAHWYKNREAVVGVDGRDSSNSVPLGFPDLIAGGRDWV